MLTILGCKPGDESATHPNPTRATAPRPSIDSTPGSVSLPLERSAIAILDEEIRKRGSLTFRSWNGKWIGMDGDTDLTFLPGGVVHMFEYADAVSGYHGTYKVTDRGDLTAQFPKFGNSWPPMTLRRDAKSLLLLPAQSAQGTVMGNRGGATIIEPDAYWPFRPLTPAEGREVRERIRNEQ